MAGGLSASTEDGRPGAQRVSDHDRTEADGGRPQAPARGGGRRAGSAPPRFGPLLSAMRDERGLPKNQLAAAADLDPSTVTRLESGERGPSREVVERLAKALDASSEELHGLLTAADLLPAEAAILLDEPELARLSAVLTDPTLTVLHRRLLLNYVELAVAHAQALGYAASPSGPRR